MASSKITPLNDSAEDGFAEGGFVEGGFAKDSDLPIWGRRRIFSLPKTISVATVAAMACGCAAIGLLSVMSTVQALWGVWQSDALKSVGLAVPFVCFALILRDWRRLGWVAEGTWWGFALLAATVLLVFVRDQTLLIVTVNKDWLLQLPPRPLIAVVYAASFVLLFGGTRLLRAAWFPVALMWAVIPVPQTFARRVDVPLQHIGAVVARGFAHLIGVRLSSMDLKIMFTPTMSMFIAPGCDGLRGSITMGLTAIAVAYYYRFRWAVFVPVVVAGVLLGYVFNFLRLCAMVVYDKITVSHPALGPHEPLADHIVGGCIFVLALAIFFAAIERLKRPAAEAVAVPLGPVAAWPVLAKAAAVVLLAGVFGVDALRTARAMAAQPVGYPALPAVLGVGPAAGQYHLVRTWTDETGEGVVVYAWGEYAGPVRADGSADRVSVGVSPHLSVHDAEVCHIARGLDPVWHGQMEVASVAGPMALTAAMYNDGATERFEASSVCDGGVCRQYSGSSEHVTLVYARPSRTVPLQAVPGHPVPVMLKVQTSDAETPVSVAQPAMQAEIARFLQQVDVVALAERYRRS